MRTIYRSLLLGCEYEKFIDNRIVGYESLPSEMRELLRKGATIINIDNVAEYAGSQIEYDRSFKSIPQVRLPWNMAWFEWKIPGTTPLGGGFSRIGALFYEDPINVEKVYNSNMRALPPNLGDGAVTLNGKFFGYAPNGGRLISIGGPIHLLVNQNGEVARYSEEFAAFFLSDLCIPYTNKNNEIGDRFPWLEIVTPVLLAICFSNCKNVKLVGGDHESITGPRGKPSKKKESESSVPVSWKTLDIFPTKKVIESHGPIGSAEWKNALHTCRGHFKTYSADHPLLGKHTGTWWWGQQIRGDRNMGIVHKGYSVHPEEES